MPTRASSTRPAAAAWRRFARNRAAMAGLVLVLFFLLMAAFGPWVAPRDPLKQQLEGSLGGPSWSHGLGRDELGRDILSRILYGARISLGMALGACLIAAGAGVTVGLVAADRGGVLEEILMRAGDVVVAFPGLPPPLPVGRPLGPRIVHVAVAVRRPTPPALPPLAPSTP